VDQVPTGTPTVYINNQLVQSAGIAVSNSVTIELRTGFPGGSIFYTLDGSDPAVTPLVYTGPFVVSNTVTVRAFASSTTFLGSAEMMPITITVIAPPMILR